jgi:hypothetical protein
VNRGGLVVRMFHEATKHSPESVRRRAHFLDWDNRPHPFKVYEGMERVPLPMDQAAPRVSAVEAPAEAGPVQGGSVDLAGLALLLRYGAGVLEHRRYPGVRFRRYASAGALYPVEAYVVCGEFPGLEDGTYHFDPEGFALNRLRLGDHRAMPGSWAMSVVARPLAAAHASQCGRSERTLARSERRDLPRSCPYALDLGSLVGAGGFEPPTSSVSGKRSPPELSARGSHCTEARRSPTAGPPTRSGVAVRWYGQP